LTELSLQLKDTTERIKAVDEAAAVVSLHPKPLHQLEEFEKNDPGCERRPGRRIEPPQLGSTPAHQLEEFEKNNPGCERRPARRIDSHIGIHASAPT